MGGGSNSSNDYKAKLVAGAHSKKDKYHAHLAPDNMVARRWGQISCNDARDKPRQQVEQKRRSGRGPDVLSFLVLCRFLVCKRKVISLAPAVTLSIENEKTGLADLKPIRNATAFLTAISLSNPANRS